VETESWPAGADSAVNVAVNGGATVAAMRCGVLEWGCCMMVVPFYAALFIGIFAAMPTGWKFPRPAVAPATSVWHCFASGVETPLCK
jgi:hypothetical protein